MRKHRNLTSHNFIFWQLLCVIELCLCRLNSLTLFVSLSLSHSLTRCLSVCLQLKATAESMLMLTSASWESRCLRLINAARSSVAFIDLFIKLLCIHKYIHTHVYISTYILVQGNELRADDQENKEVHTEQNRHKRSTRSRRSGGRRSKQARRRQTGGQADKRERTRQKFRFSSCQAANGTAYVAHRQEWWISVCWRERARGEEWSEGESARNIKAETGLLQEMWEEENDSTLVVLGVTSRKPQTQTQGVCYIQYNIEYIYIYVHIKLYTLCILKHSWSFKVILRIQKTNIVSYDIHMYLH